MTMHWRTDRAAVTSRFLVFCFVVTAGWQTPQVDAQELVYSNTGADLLLPPGADRRIADDIFVTELCGCRLDSYELTLGGGGDGTGPGFAADIGIYDACPNSGGTLIPGTEASLVFPDDGNHVAVIDLSNDFVEIPGGIWLAVEFDRNGAGWLSGAPPELGFSDDLYDFPGFACVAQIAPGFFASFAAQFYCTPAGPPEVENPTPEDGAANVSPHVVLAWNGGNPAVAAPPDEPTDPVTPDNFESGFVHPDEAIQQMEDAVANGEVPDPATLEIPAVAPRQYFGPASGNVAGFEVPNVTPSDIFWYEDSTDLLVTNLTSGQLYALMADATNQVLTEHGDNFDFVAFWLNFVPDHQIGAAFYLGIENNVDGIGLGLFNNRPGFGVAGDNVEGWVMMWNQANWNEGYFTFTQLVLGQEFEHRWGMFLDPLPGNRPLQGNNGSCGRSSHWNFRVDGQGSGMEIAEWVGASPAVRQGGTLNFNSDIEGSVFSYPDLYLMGYVPGSEMDTAPSELRYMDDNTNCNDTYSGPISTFTASDIVATNGIRNPSFVQAQKHFSTAWVMIHRPGSPPTSGQLSHVTNILNTWNDVWITSVLNRGTMSNVLNPIEPQLCAVNYDVLVDVQNPPQQTACDDITSEICDPGTLDIKETYFWQVVATDEKGTTDGPVWTFNTAGGGPDCNGNGVPDDLDIADGVSDDCDGNGVPDECDPDGDVDGVPDACDVCPDGDDTIDNDMDGMPDDCDACPLDNPNDSDNDGVCNSDDVCPNGDDNLDTDGDGAADDCDVCPLDNPNDTDGDGVCDSDDQCPGADDSDDGDGDGIPDQCDDCPADNPNDPDNDDVCTSDDNCELPNPLQQDCQPNGVGDVCDIDAGTSADTDGNGVPDECEAFPPAAPLAEQSLKGDCSTDNDCPNTAVCSMGACYAPKNRYLSIDANPENAGRLTARRIRLDIEGTPMDLGWIGQPEALVLAGEPAPILVARIETVPFYADWNSFKSTSVHVGDCEIAPGHVYLIDAINQGDDAGEGTNFSDSVSLPTTSVWTDVIGNDPGLSPPDGSVNFVDIQSVVLGFQALQTVPKVWLELEGTGNPSNVPDVSAIGFPDIFRAVQGFQGGGYPFVAPLDCP